MLRPKVSSFIKSQVPEFINQDHPVFVKLLESYYDFMEQGGINSPIGFLRAAIEQKDIDLAEDVFKEYIKRQVLPELPVNELSKVDANTLIKHVKELVSIKGTLDSYQFTMKAIYDEEVRTQQMGDFLLRASDNEYTTKTIIVVKNLPGATHDLLKLLGSSLVQQEPIAAAFVDSVQMVSHGGVDYYICTLRRDTIFGDFTVGGKVTGKFRETGESVIVQLDHILGNVEVSPGSEGSLYFPGQALNLIDGSGFNGQVLIDEVTPGGVDDAIIVKRGYGHLVGDNISFISNNGSGTNAVGEVTAIDGVDAALSPVLELDSVTIKDAGNWYNVGNLIELILPGENVNPVVKVDTITTSPAVVDIVYGGTYSSVKVLWKDNLTYYRLQCTVENGTVTYVPIPDVTWTTTPTFYVGGQGAIGSLLTTAALAPTDSTYAGTITLTTKGYNYDTCPVVKFYTDAGFTNEVSVNGGLIKYTYTADYFGVDTVIISDSITFKDIPAGTTLYFKVVCTSGSGFIGNLKMGGKVATTSIYRRGTIYETRGDILSYSVPTRLFGTTAVNESAIFDAEYRLKEVIVEDIGAGYTNSFTLPGFDTTSGLPTVTYLAGGLITNNQIKVGSLVTGAAVPADTYVLSIDSETQLTLTKNATATLVGTSLTFGGNVVSIAGGKGAGAILSPIIVNGGIASVTINVGGGGTGYTADTTIQVFSSTGSGAVLRPVIVGGVITSVTVVDCGENYTNTDLVVVTDSVGVGASLTLVTANGMIRRINVLNGGENYQLGATLTITGTGASATATPTITEGHILAVTMTNRGSGYTSAAVTINTLGVSAAINLTVAQSGIIESVDVINGGEGYWDPTEVTPLTVSVSAPTSPSLDAGGTGYTVGLTTVSIAGDGIGASAIANVRSTDGKVLSVTMVSIGSGYTYADVTINGSGTGAFGIARIDNGAIVEIAIVSGKLAKVSPTLNAAGGIEIVEIIDPGFGYITSPTITITGGGGVGASITAATVDVVKRQLTGFTIVEGSGYKYGTKIIVDGDGTGAVLTPVVNTGITKLDIIDGGEKFTHPKIMIYEAANKTATVELTTKITEAKVKKFIGRLGVGTFIPGDVIFVGVSPARAIKKGIVVKVEGSTANPIIHYYMQDMFTVHFSAEDFIQCERSASVYCTAGVGSGAVIDTVYKDGAVTALSVVSQGMDYVQNSTIEIVNLDGYGAKGTINVDIADAFNITEATVTAGGTGYYNRTDIIVNQWVTGTVYAAGTEVWYGAYQYVTTLGGTSGITPPTHITGTVSDGGVSWTFLGYKGVSQTVLIHSNTLMESDVQTVYVSGVIDGYNIVEAGTGYVSPSSVVYNNPGDAEVTVTLSAGGVSAINITKNGIYTSGIAPTVVIIGNGVGAVVTAVLAADNSIASFTINTAGTGYTWAHAYLTDNAGINEVIDVFAERPIKSVTITNAGTGYNYTFLSVYGDGEFAALEANLAGDGSITSSAVTTQGTRYTTFPIISVRDVSAIGAVSKVAIRNKGYGYTTLPLAVIENNVSGALVVAVSRTIGAVKGFNITDFGFGYEEVPLISFPLNVITAEMAYPFMDGELVYVDGYNYPNNDFTQGPHAYVKSVDLDRNLVELQGASDVYNLIVAMNGTQFDITTERDETIVNEMSNYIGIGSVIVGERTKLKTKILWQNRAIGTISNAAIGRFKAQFTKSSGYLSNADIRLQDSYRYHDYAYKVTTGLSLKDYESTLKALVHPSGYKLFGDILIEGYGSTTVDMPTTDAGDQVSDVSFVLLFSLYASLFIGKYTAYVETLLWLTVAEISPFQIKEIIDATADLTPYISELRRARLWTQICRFLNMSDPGTLTMTDATLVDSIVATTRVSVGSGYNPLTTTATVVTSTGSGAILEPIVSGGQVVAVNVIYGGSGYAVTDTISIVGDGVGANYTISIYNVPFSKITRSTGSWITDGFDEACSRFTVGTHVMMIYRDWVHQVTATDMYVKYDVVGPFTGLFTAGTYTWAADTITVTSTGHGLVPNQAVVLTFTSGGMTTSHPWAITYVDANTFTVPWTGSGTGGNVTIERSFGSEKLV